MSVVSMHTVPKGTAFVRYAVALALAKGDGLQAVEIAKRPQWRSETPEVEAVLRTATTIGTTSSAIFAGPLSPARPMVAEWLATVQPRTILGRVKTRNAPLNVAFPRQTSDAAMAWVGQGAPTPTTSFAFDTLTLGIDKIGGIAVISQELARAGTAAAEGIVGSILAAAYVRFADAQFIDPSVAAVADQNPVSITHAATAIASTGASVAEVTADLRALLDAVNSSGAAFIAPAFVMHPTNAIALSALRNTDGTFAFVGISVLGGVLLGVPVVVSANCPDNIIVLADFDQVFVGDDGVLTIDASGQASLQMDTSPANPPDASTVFVSTFQENLRAIKLVRYITWAAGRADAVAVLTGVDYSA